MLAAILAILGELVKFGCTAGLNWIEKNSEVKKERDKIYNEEIKPATTQRDRINAINRFNRVR